MGLSPGMPLRLRELIRDVASPSPGKEAEAELIVLCQSMAVVLVRKRAAVGRLDLGLFGVSADDLALDCIADLFQRDDRGLLVQIVAYFESIPVDTSTDEELLSHLRRLVFARVNQSLFTFYNEVDPSLGKIIRNIKLAVSSLRNFQLVDRLGERYLVPALCDAQEELAPLDRDELAAVVHQAARGSNNIPEVLARLGRFLRQERDHSRLVPLVGLAIAIRSFFAAQEHAAEPGLQPEDRFTASDAEQIITSVCAEVKAEMRRQYVEKKNIESAVYDAYFEVIRRYVAGRILQPGDAPIPLYEMLRGPLPSLTKEEYKSAHKSRLEYLEKLVTGRTLEELRKGL